MTANEKRSDLFLTHVKHIIEKKTGVKSQILN